MCVRCLSRRLNFYPRPPRGGRRSRRCCPMTKEVFLSTPSARRATAYQRPVRREQKISIHALREEGDTKPSQSSGQRMYFYPRPPRGGRRCSPSTPTATTTISIHALREEGDGSCRPSSRWTRNFYPRPPRGGRPTIVWTCSRSRIISIHALREEGDCYYVFARYKVNNFYPRPPRGGRHSLPASTRPDR